LNAVKYFKRKEAQVLKHF